jgi:hypothetical protein
MFIKLFHKFLSLFDFRCPRLAKYAASSLADSMTGRITRTGYFLACAMASGRRCCSHKASTVDANAVLTTRADFD